MTIPVGQPLSSLASVLGHCRGRRQVPGQLGVDRPGEAVADQRHGVEDPQPERRGTGDADAEQPAEGPRETDRQRAEDQEPLQEPDANTPVTSAPRNAARQLGRPGPTTRKVQVSGHRSAPRPA